jgi:hypothetical protein
MQETTNNKDGTQAQVVGNFRKLGEIKICLHSTLQAANKEEARDGKSSNE